MLKEELDFLNKFAKHVKFQNSRDLEMRIQIRDTQYAVGREALEKPLAFICHDSRDKEEIAIKLARRLRSMACPVWYDEFSLKVGDSLRESIEKGLKECKKCVLVLTPNFLSNGGWTKKEFNSIFTREIIEKKNIILPVWHNVTKENIYEYSPSLADKYALDWNSGEDDVVRHLYGVLMD